MGGGKLEYEGFLNFLSFNGREEDFERFLKKVAD